MKHKNLKLAVKNFGPIREGEVEFKPLTVFIGPNNSGKSYMATLLYALTQALTGSVRPPFFPDSLSDEDEQIIEKWTHAIFGRVNEPNKALDSHVRSIFQNHFDCGVERLEKDTQEAIRDYFGVRSLSDLMYQGHEREREFSIDLFGHHSYEELASVREGIDDAYSQIDSRQIISQPLGLEALQNVLKDVAWERMQLFPASFIVFQGMVRLWRQNLASIGMSEGNILYLPAGRSGLLQGWRAIASLGVSLIGRRIGTENFAIPSFPGLAREFTQQLIEIMPPDSYYQEDERLAHAISLMEERILNGKIELRVSSSLPEMTYESVGVSIPVLRSSSMISELAPIHLWMKHILKSGDTLIIDEPEAHLHPENQRLVAQVLVRLMNAGVRVVCATHSSLILHQLSNQILATSSNRLDEVGFAEHDRLNLDDIGVYLFEPSEDGTHIKEVEVDSEFGISEDEFVRVADQIGDETYQLLT